MAFRGALLRARFRASDTEVRLGISFLSCVTSTPADPIAVLALHGPADYNKDNVNTTLYGNHQAVTAGRKAASVRSLEVSRGLSLNLA